MTTLDGVVAVGRQVGLGSARHAPRAKMEHVVMDHHRPTVTPMLTDFYQITMTYAYWKCGKRWGSPLSLWRIPPPFPLCFSGIAPKYTVIVAPRFIP